MNRKLIFTNAHGKRVSCILSGERDELSQLEEIFGIRKGYGFSLDITKDKVRIVDYFHGETRAEFLILSAEDTAREPILQLSAEEEE